MKELLLSPQVIAAFIAGTFAIICRFIEKKPDGTKVPMNRGTLGWFALIAAMAAILLAFFSITWSRKAIESEGAFEGTSKASTEIVCAKPSTAVVSVQIVAQATKTNFRSYLGTKLSLNGAVMNTDMQRQGPADEHSKEVVLTAVLPLKTGNNQLVVESSGEEVGAAKITARYFILTAK